MHMSTCRATRREAEKLKRFAKGANFRENVVSLHYSNGSQSKLQIERDLSVSGHPQIVNPPAPLVKSEGGWRVDHLHCCIALRC